MAQRIVLFAPKQPLGFFFTGVTSNTQGWPYWWAFVVGLPQGAVDVHRLRRVGERAGGLVAALAAMAMWFCGLSAVTWTSRVIYAFARDQGMPASAIWKRVSRRHLTPAPAIWLSAAVAFVATISSGTYAVVTSISVIGLYVSYIVPVFLAWRARGSAAGPERGPWHLGRFGAAINLVAMLWVLFISAILAMPDGMRAGKTIAALTAALAAWYLIAERHRFQGPAWSAPDS